MDTNATLAGLQGWFSRWLTTRRLQAKCSSWMFSKSEVLKFKRRSEHARNLWSTYSSCRDERWFVRSSKWMNVFFSTQQYHVPQTTYLLSKISPIKISSIPIQTKSQNTTFLQRIELLPYSCGNACFPIDCRHAPLSSAAPKEQRIPGWRVKAMKPWRPRLPSQ